MPIVCRYQRFSQPLVGRHDPVPAAISQQDVVECDQRLRLHRVMPGKTRDCGSDKHACQTRGEIGYNAPPSLLPPHRSQTMTKSTAVPVARPGRVGFVSLGCPKALVDSERILT